MVTARKVFKLALRLALLALAVWFCVVLVTRVDWAQVRVTLRHLSAAQIVLIAVLAALRIAVAAYPLTLYLPGLGLRRAVQNDLVGGLTLVVAPPPSDAVARLAMFSSWKISPEQGVAALSLNELIFYVARLAAPVFGFTVLWVFVRYDSTYAVAAAICGVLAAALAGGLYIVLRWRSAARAIGRTAGRLAHRVRSSVDPTAWEDALTRYRSTMAATVRRVWAPASLAQLALLGTETVLVLACLRATGITDAMVPAVEVAAAFLLVYPLSMLPLSGLGVLDLALLELLQQAATADITDAFIAAMIVWRFFALLLPLGAGAIATVRWRRWVARQAETSSTSTKSAY